jgi:Helicase conserved C-terminal domain
MQLYNIIDAHAFLSGDLATRLEKSDSALEFDQSFQKEIDALAKVMPIHIGITDITTSIGSTWIPSHYYEEFCLEKFGVEVRFFWSNIAGCWEVNAISSIDKDANTSTYGYTYEDVIGEGKTITKNIPAIASSIEAGLFTSALHFKTPKSNEREKGKVQAKQDELRQLWTDWCKDGERGEELEQIYNRQFNRVVLPNWDNTAPKDFRETLKAAGLSDEWAARLRPYQLDSIWRMTLQGNGLLGLEVGLGKTGCACAIAMLRKHYRTLKTAMIVVQKSTLLQFAATFRDMFPNAKVLCATPEDCNGKNRQMFLAKAVLWGWDAIILTHESFKAIPVRPETERKFVQQKLNVIESELWRLYDAGESARRNGKKRGNRIVKKLEEMRDKMYLRINELKSKRDNGIFFEDINPDLLVIDEAQRYKNNYFATKMTVKGLNVAQSDRAEDLDLKISFFRYTRKTNNYLLMMTGTPEPTNSMSGVFIFQQYLQPDALASRGIMHFDSWAANFGKVVSKIEPGVAGNLVQSERFAEFVNVPELLQMYLGVCHIKRFADVEGQGDFTRPKLKTKTVSSPLTKFQIEEMENLRERMAYIKIFDPKKFPDRDNDECLFSNHEDKKDRVRLYHPITGAPLREVVEAITHNIKFGVKVDNMLWVLTDAIKLMVAPQLFDPELPIGRLDKISLAVRRIYRWWRLTKKQRSTQLVFLDKGVPSGKSKFKIYNWMRDHLMELGIPKEEIAFIQDYSEDEEKEQLFKRVDDGDVRVLFGSTEPMGVGVNVQAKVKVVHFLDIPRRPDEYEQRLGRAIRPGNENEKVVVYQYLSKGQNGNFGADAAQMKMLENKIKSREQILKGDPNVRRAVEDDDQQLLFMMFSAHATGNERFIELMELNRDIEIMENKSNLLIQEINRLNIGSKQGSIKNAKERITRLERDLIWVEGDLSPVNTWTNSCCTDQQFAAVFHSEYNGSPIQLLYTGVPKGQSIGSVADDYNAMMMPMTVKKARDEFNEVLIGKIETLALEAQMRGSYIRHPEEEIGRFGGLPIMCSIQIYGNQVTKLLWLQGQNFQYSFSFSKTVMVRDLIDAYKSIPEKCDRLKTAIEKAYQELNKSKALLEQKRAEKEEVNKKLREMRTHKKFLEDALASKVEE